MPFALLFVLLAQVEWTQRLLRLCFGLLVGLALVFSAIGYVEYATKHIFLNPKLIASNDLHTYFRTNSVFFDPNIYGRFLVVAMLAVAATMLQAARAEVLDRRGGAGGAVGGARADAVAVVASARCSSGSRRWRCCAGARGGCCCRPRRSSRWRSPRC